MILVICPPSRTIVFVTGLAGGISLVIWTGVGSTVPSLRTSSGVGSTLTVTAGASTVTGDGSYGRCARPDRHFCQLGDAVVGGAERLGLAVDHAHQSHDRVVPGGRVLGVVLGRVVRGRRRLGLLGAGRLELVRSYCKSHCYR